MAEIIDFKTKIKRSGIKETPTSILLKTLLKNQNDIDSIVFFIRHKDGNMYLGPSEGVDFTTWCCAKALLDYQVNMELDEDNE